MAYAGGIVTAVVAYEYQRWRDGSTRESERKQGVRQSVRSELTKFTSGWAVFKTTLDMQVNPGLENYRHELAGIGYAVRNMLSSPQGLLETQLVEDGIKIPGDLIKLSLWQFYADGTASFNTMIKFGDETAERCQELEGKQIIIVSPSFSDFALDSVGIKAVSPLHIQRGQVLWLVKFT